MAVFAYSARTKEGKTVSGTLRAPDRNVAQGELRKKNLSVVTLNQSKEKPKRGLFGPPRPHVKNKDISVLTRQLATMVSAGIPLVEATEILHDQAADPGFKLVLEKIIDKIRSGSDFSTALSEHPKLFSKIFINMVKAGEASGQLDVILSRLSEYLESAEALKGEIKSAMTYPVVSLFLIFGIAVFLMVGVVPKFEKIFEQMGMTELPLPTQIMLAISNFMQHQFMLMMGLIVGSIVGFVMYIRTRRGEYQFHWCLLHVPVFGVLFRKVAISRFSRTFATLIRSGVPMLGALDIVAGTAGNRVIEEAVLKAKERVTKGDPLGEPLEETKVFPPMVTRMISIGEKTGALEQLLLKISEFYDQEVRATVKSLTSLIEPIMIVIMGVMVGGIVLAIFLPILAIQQKLSK